MADTLPNIELPPNIWVDLYAATGIAVGTQILVQNIGVCDVYLFSGPAMPDQGDNDMHQIITRAQFAKNDQGDAGAYAMCIAGGLVNVRLPPST